MASSSYGCVGYEVQSSRDFISRETDKSLASEVEETRPDGEEEEVLQLSCRWQGTVMDGNNERNLDFHVDCTRYSITPQILQHILATTSLPLRKVLQFLGEKNNSIRFRQVLIMESSHQIFSFPPQSTFRTRQNVVQPSKDLVPSSSDGAAAVSF